MPSRNPAKPNVSIRRSSVYASSNANRPSLQSTSHIAAPPKESRPVRDKNFQIECMRNLSDYLVNVRYPAPVTSKTLSSPTAKEFQSIFRYLASTLIDPGMIWSKKFEDDALTMLKDLRYPGLESISKTAFTAPGAPQSWPSMLAMLNWLVELCKAHDNWNDTNCISDPILSLPTELPLDHPYLEDRMLWNFASKTYNQWFDGGAEEFPEAEQELMEMYAVDRVSVANAEQTFSLAGILQKYQLELQQLQIQEPPLRKLEDEYLQLMGDKTKFIAFIDLHRQKADKTRQAILKIRAAVSEQRDELETHRSNLIVIENAIAAQNLSPDEVNRMNHERDSLHRALDDLRGKIAEASQASYDNEMLVTRGMDRFETLHAEYAALTHNIGKRSLQSEDDSENVPMFDADIDVDLGVADLDALKSIGTFMRSSIWQGLQSRRERYRQEKLTLDNHAIVQEDLYDRSRQEVERQMEEVSTLEVKLKMIHDQADAAQTKLATDNVNTNKVIAQLENEVTSMLAASQQGVLVSQSQLESDKIAYKELRHRTAILQDTLVSHIGIHIDAIIRAKEHTNNSLRSIRLIAEAQ
uniref:Kinetochore protein NDC80 n=1 Tax=Kwoniella pini CBS 10737 TaxID=1296096 RepID=A0A1B9HWC7_9TREE|nr:uncharacterized protein I206_06475 [Kwoniella pini CBS 10737]OCF47572.1 hypothetical protein I206_06475 [Kwoniella pini CBS 10737]